jgi:hypothetical protein
MTDLVSTNPTPQFGTAEYVDTPGTDHCQYCHAPIAGTYYRVNETMTCSACAEKMRAELARDTHAAFVRGILFGIGAAILGMILYATFAIATGVIIGYASLAVGWLVGKAIIKGSGGVGGKRYQIAAVILTYCAVSMAAVPIWIHYANQEHREKQKRTAPQGQQSENQQLQGQQSNAQQSKDAVTPTQASNGSAPAERPSMLSAVGKLALIGIASPFVELWEGGPGFQWVIGIVILVVGLRIAWRVTASPPLTIYGPFEQSAQPAR